MDPLISLICSTYPPFGNYLYLRLCFCFVMIIHLYHIFSEIITTIKLTHLLAHTVTSLFFWVGVLNTLSPCAISPSTYPSCLPPPLDEWIFVILAAVFCGSIIFVFL